MIKYVVGFMFDPGDKDHVVLQEKQRGPAWMHGLLNGPGGVIEGDETPAEAMSREYREETGFDSLPQNWCFFLTMEGNDGEGWRVYYFYTFGDVTVPYQRGSEPVAAYQVSCLPRLVVPDLHWLIPMCLHGPLVGQPMPTRLYLPANHDLKEIYPVGKPQTGVTEDGVRIKPEDGVSPCEEYDPAGLGAGLEEDGCPQEAHCGHPRSAHKLKEQADEIGTV